MSEVKHAKYLVNEDTREVKLFHGDEVEDAMKEGWELPSTPKSNGEPWNPEPEEGELYVNDAAAESQRASAKQQEKKDARKAEQAKAAKKKGE